jgi:rSAM/selenodomain-associated transferase 2
LTRISAIVPTLDEAGEIVETLERARQALGPDVELVVADGGSTDRTVELASAWSRTVSSAACRGAQIAAGAETATGDILLFLHADGWLDPDAGNAIRDAIANGAAAGCLTLRFRPPADLRYRLLARGIAARTRLFRTATGDQAIFATREAYAAAGGVRPLPLFEDVVFVRAVRGRGRFVQLGTAVHASGRRWRERGFFRTVATHAALRLAFALGANPHALDRSYRRARASSRIGA